MEALGELRALTQQLNLTPEQREKVRPIVTEEGEQLRVVRLDEHLTPDQRRQKSLEIREAFQPKVAALLTPEQQGKFKKMQETYQVKRPEGAKDSATPAPAPPK